MLTLARCLVVLYIEKIGISSFFLGDLMKYFSHRPKIGLKSQKNLLFAIMKMPDEETS